MYSVVLLEEDEELEEPEVPEVSVDELLSVGSLTRPPVLVALDVSEEVGELPAAVVSASLFAGYAV